jgi:hypothetical protein
VSSPSVKPQTPGKDANAEYGAFPRKSSQSGSQLQADSRLNSFQPASPLYTLSRSSAYPSSENYTLSQPVHNQSRMAIGEPGHTNQNFSITVPQFQPALDELTKAVSRKNLNVIGPMSVARSEE